MKSIYKYTLRETGSIEMPVGAKIISCQLQNEIVTIWAFVDDTARIEKRRFEIIGTGWACNIIGYTFLATLQFRNGLVFHVFELP